MDLDFPIDNLPPEDIAYIDIDAINQDSESEAKSMIKVVTELFYDEQFKKDHPKIHRRIELEIETLRGLIKMRKADEEAHDCLLQAIGENKTNASLYRSMAEIQKTSIALTAKIHDTLDRLNKICTDLTASSEYEDPTTEVESEESDGEIIQSKAHRGSKAFIEEMIGSK